MTAPVDGSRRLPAQATAPADTELDGVARLASHLCGGGPAVLVVDQLGIIAAHGVTGAAVEVAERAGVLAELTDEHGRPVGSLRVAAADAPGAEAVARLADLAAAAAGLLERRRLRAALARSANRDPLTGLANRRSAEDAIAAAIARAERGLGTPSVVVVDLDRFDDVNETFGSAAGDAVLRSVAERLARTARAVDTVGRLGGDEFVVLLESTGGPGATAALRRLRRCVQEGWGVGTGGPADVAASFGITTYRPGDSVASLIARADAEMYADKTSRVAAV